MRVVSVLPSATEIVHALGHGAELVGRSAECDFPSEVSRLPVVMRPRTLDSDRPSREIDARVREAFGRGESLYELDIDLLRTLTPDLLLTQDLCSVCSVTEAEVADALTRAGVAPRVLSLGPRTLEEVWRSFGSIAVALGDPASGERLSKTVRERTALPRPTTAHRRVAVVEWVDPPILAGLWTPDILRAAGGEPVGPASGAPARRTSWTELAAERPDLVVLSPCSFSVARTLRELGHPEVRRGVNRLAPALGTYVADEAYFSRPGPRLAEGVRLIRDLLTGTPPERPMPVERWEPPSTEVVA
jgi:iron complex transport system substrate-binding protein